MRATMRTRRRTIRGGLPGLVPRDTAAVSWGNAAGAAARRVAAAAIRSSGKVTKDSAYPKLRRYK